MVALSVCISVALATLYDIHQMLYPHNESLSPLVQCSPDGVSAHNRRAALSRHIPQTTLPATRNLNRIPRRVITEKAEPPP
jgi:hypothetical protein